MRKLDAGTYRTMPWKNGGGSTTEVARAPRAPAGDSLDDFDWRISMACVASAGPFSHFAGVDRSIAILDGDGLVLAIEGQGETRLDRSSPPFAFAGDVPVMASLTNTRGAIVDFNVMTRRGRYRHRLTRARFDESGTFAALADVNILFVVEGNAEATRGTTREQVGPHDALVFEAGDPVALTPAPAASLLAVALWRD
jgi:environmental stress-induced protein Ves